MEKSWTVQSISNNRISWYTYQIKKRMRATFFDFWVMIITKHSSKFGIKTQALGYLIISATLQFPLLEFTGLEWAQPVSKLTCECWEVLWRYPQNLWGKQGHNWQDLALLMANTLQLWPVSDVGDRQLCLKKAMKAFLDFIKVAFPGQWSMLNPELTGIY